MLLSYSFQTDSKKTLLLPMKISTATRLSLLSFPAWSKAVVHATVELASCWIPEWIVPFTILAHPESMSASHYAVNRVKILLKLSEIKGSVIFPNSKWCNLCWRCQILSRYNKHNSEKVDLEEELVLKRRRITIHKVGYMLGTSFGPVKHAVKDNVKCAGLPPTWTPLVEREAVG
jgi:hypothetical protein